MNYIRGAVNAISAPYQYYKELPPINPSTLTGAIDVIVIRRPTDNGDSELVCSPFHVRFGKWQVLRPGEKKVNVSVNGKLIPFNMKIGEAGEAFFVFETSEDVPEDLITSPVLAPTVPSEHTEQANVVASDFGPQQDPGDLTRGGNEEEIGESAKQEPDFLDLDAVSSPELDEDVPFKTAPLPPSTLPSAAPRSASTQRLEQVFQDMQSSVHVPKVQFSGNLALDAEGYHSHPRESTVDDSDVIPTAATSRSVTPPAHDILGTQSNLDIMDNDPNSIAFHSPRATSEPPPDMDEPPESQQEQQDPHTELATPSQYPVPEYSWEWGAFPRPSPVRTTFGKGGRIEVARGSSKDIGAVWEKTTGKVIGGRLALLQLKDEEGQGREGMGTGKAWKRSRSVPPELEGSPRMKKREISMYEEYDGDGEEEAEEGEGETGLGVGGSETGGFGAGGKLTTSRSDPTKFRVYIEGRRVGFELCLAPSVEGTGDVLAVFDGRDEVEAARLFGEGKFEFERFLEDESVVTDPRLVIRWAGGRYITRSDGSPLMDSLVLWRDAALQRRSRGLPSRPTSPFSDEDEGARSNNDSVAGDIDQNASKSPTPPEGSPLVRGKPTSSSWVKWWRRSQNNHEAGSAGISGGKRERPELTPSVSLPSSGDGLSMILKQRTEMSNGIPPTEVVVRAVSSSPAVISVKQVHQDPTAKEIPGASQAKRKFAKTLRLTSDQLKSLDLKPGANCITFSLSTSGVIACTARIFVWESTDLVLVSDIDGTITKSDGLGHVFAMIGRDWTHSGVAKLYTDIVRNGYKIMYLTSRAIGQADATRDYLKGIKQNDYQLPEGPVIMSPDRLMASLHREVIMRKPEVFKMACLRDIQRLFGEASRNPFYAGFGNRITDALSYRSVNVPSSRIFTIDSTGEVKLELLELTGYKSSYFHMTDLVDQMFPPINRKWAPEFTDFSYWKTPLHEYPLPDLSPPSPALSARSDTSNQSTLAKLRNFSLVGNRQANNAKQLLPPPATDQHAFDRGMQDHYRSSQLRQMSSFERLSSTIAGFASSSSGRGSVSPTSHSSSSLTYGDSDDEDIEAFDLDGKRQRRRSMSSMPGSLDDDMHFGMDGDEDEHLGGEVEDDHYTEEDGEDIDESAEDEEEAVEKAFNEDLFAAGEMQNVPFL